MTVQAILVLVFFSSISASDGVSGVLMMVDACSVLESIPQAVAHDNADRGLGKTLPDGKRENT